MTHLDYYYTVLEPAEQVAHNWLRNMHGSYAKLANKLALCPANTDEEVLDDELPTKYARKMFHILNHHVFILAQCN